MYEAITIIIVLSETKINLNSYSYVEPSISKEFESIRSWPKANFSPQL